MPVSCADDTAREACRARVESGPRRLGGVARPATAKDQGSDDQATQPKAAGVHASSCTQLWHESGHPRDLCASDLEITYLVQMRRQSMHEERLRTSVDRTRQKCGAIGAHVRAKRAKICQSHVMRPARKLCLGTVNFDREQMPCSLASTYSAFILQKHGCYDNRQPSL